MGIVYMYMGYTHGFGNLQTGDHWHQHLSETQGSTGMGTGTGTDMAFDVSFRRNKNRWNGKMLDTKHYNT